MYFYAQNAAGAAFDFFWKGEVCMIEVSHLTKEYHGRPVIRDLSFTVEDGQICGLLGPNGAGKSTIMNILSGYLSPGEGSVTISGHPLPQEAREARRCIGYLPEIPPLYPDMTVQEYLLFAAELKKIKASERREQVLRAARRTGLEDVMPRLIRSLSKGYCQRVGIAQALLGSPPIIILDEPTVGLDPAQVIEIRTLIWELARRHTVILSSHILSEVQAVCDKILILSKGELAAEGTPEQLSKKLGTQEILHVTALGSRDTVLSAVQAIPGLEEVQLEPSGGEGEVSLTARCAAGEDQRAAVSRALAEAGCTVIALTSEARSLEEIFLALTARAPGSGGEAPAADESDASGEKEE